MQTENLDSNGLYHERQKHSISQTLIVRKIEGTPENITIYGEGKLRFSLSH